MISAVVLTKNEEKNIIDCLESISFCDEILIVDDYSDDRTEEIAHNYGARVIKAELSNDFAKQRNIGLRNAKNNWVLFVDADERIGKNLADEIIEVVRRGKKDGYFLKREDIMWGKRLSHGEIGKIKLLRLGKKGKGLWEGKVHEKWLVAGYTGELTNPILHYPHPTISEFLSEINYYSTLRANELYRKGEKVSGYSIILYPKAKFVLNYFFRLGFLDGIPGLIFALMMSFHSFLVRGKLWQLNQKKK